MDKDLSCKRQNYKTNIVSIWVFGLGNRVFRSPKQEKKKNQTNNNNNKKQNQPPPHKKKKHQRSPEAEFFLQNPTPEIIVKQRLDFKVGKGVGV